MSQKKSSGSLSLKNLSGALGFEPTTPKKEVKSQNQIQRQPDNSIDDGMLPNLGLLYYRHYYKEMDWSVLTEINKKSDAYKEKVKANTEKLNKRNTKITERTAAEYQNTTIQGNQILDLQVIGQGLLVGSGYQHATGIEGESKLGFFFDYTTGLPIIPGSSVKGALRYAFKQVAVLQHFLAHKVAEKHRLVLTKEAIEALENEIFENKNEKGEYLPTPQRDIFFDATLNTDGKNKFLASDFITPHINRNHPALSSYSDPNPILFLKILPQTRFSFQFSLHDSQTVTSIKAAHKLALFEVILKYYGIGAKTNVGYGHFAQ